MKDICNREDVKKLVDSFYDKLLADEEMKPVFVMSMDNWPMHLVRVYNFWDNWLFQTGSYTGGMMHVHIERHRHVKLTTHLFEKWLSYWHISTDELFEGKNADFVKSKALEIGQVMNRKLNG